MGILNWLFTPEPPKTDEQLQAELKALVNAVVAQGIVWSDDKIRYENLLRQLYERGLEPSITIVRTEK